MLKPSLYQATLLCLGLFLLAPRSGHATHDHEFTGYFNCEQHLKSEHYVDGRLSRLGDVSDTQAIAYLNFLFHDKHSPLSQDLDGNFLNDPWIADDFKEILNRALALHEKNPIGPKSIEWLADEYIAVWTKKSNLSAFAEIHRQIAIDQMARVAAHYYRNLDRDNPTYAKVVTKFQEINSKAHTLIDNFLHENVQAPSVDDLQLFAEAPNQEFLLFVRALVNPIANPRLAEKMAVDNFTGHARTMAVIFSRLAKIRHAKTFEKSLISFVETFIKTAVMDEAAFIKASPDEARGLEHTKVHLAKVLAYQNLLKTLKDFANSLEEVPEGLMGRIERQGAAVAQGIANDREKLANFDKKELDRLQNSKGKADPDYKSDEDANSAELSEAPTAPQNPANPALRNPVSGDNSARLLDLNEAVDLKTFTPRVLWYQGRLGKALSAEDTPYLLDYLNLISLFPLKYELKYFKEFGAKAEKDETLANCISIYQNIDDSIALIDKSAQPNKKKIWMDLIPHLVGKMQRNETFDLSNADHPQSAVSELKGNAKITWNASDMEFKIHKSLQTILLSSDDLELWNLYFENLITSLDPQIWLENPQSLKMVAASIDHLAKLKRMVFNGEQAAALLALVQKVQLPRTVTAHGAYYDSKAMILVFRNSLEAYLRETGQSNALAKLPQ